MNKIHNKENKVNDMAIPAVIMGVVALCLFLYGVQNGTHTKDVKICKDPSNLKD